MNLRLFITFGFLFLLHGLVSAQTITRLNNTRVSSAELDKQIAELVQKANVHGLAVVVFNSNQPVYKKTFGYNNMEKKQPFSSSSNIYGASLSKAVFAVMVMKLVQEKKLDLDKPLQDYLPKPIYEYKPVKKWHDDYTALKTDTLYRKITARMCLDHTNGFNNWRWYEPDQKLRVRFEPGSRYSYSGEGLVYLQVVLEHLYGTTLEGLMQEKVFKPAGMTNSSYSWQPQFEKDYMLGHNKEGKLYEKDKDNDPRSASTLETTVDDYVKFTTAVLQHKILTESTTKEMFRTQIRIRSIAQFGPLSFRDSTTNDQVQLGYGLGWGVLQSPYGVGAFKEGHGDGFQHYSILFPKVGKAVILMSNSDNAEGIFKALLDLTIADTYTPWGWQNYIPYNQVNN